MKKETDVIKDIRNLFKCMNEKLKKKKDSTHPLYCYINNLHGRVMSQ